MTGKKPTEAEVLPLQMLIGLLISNGPGSIFAQGAKGAMAADGPQTPERVQINKAMIGFLSHSGYSHGGNGFEGMAFLLERFAEVELEDPTNAGHGIDLRAMAREFAQQYKIEKREAKERGGRERRPSESRPEHGYADAGVRLSLRALSNRSRRRYRSRAIGRERGDCRCPVVPCRTAGGTLIDCGETIRTAPDIPWVRYAE